MGNLPKSDQSVVSDLEYGVAGTMSNGGSEGSGRPEAVYERHCILWCDAIRTNEAVPPLPNRQCVGDPKKAK
jgi:hypothetical protein